MKSQKTTLWLLALALCLLVVAGIIALRTLRTGPQEVQIQDHEFREDLEGIRSVNKAQAPRRTNDLASFKQNAEDTQMQQQEFREDLERIASVKKSFTPGPTNDLAAFEEFADEISNKWSEKNREYYARLIWEICKPLGSGDFKEDRAMVLARKYALSALAKPDEIPVKTELELMGYMVRNWGPGSPEGQAWAEIRRKEVRIRLHGWKRLLDAIDPTWDPNDRPFLNVPLPPGVEGVSGMSPDVIKDPKQRAEYEAAIEKNRQKAQRNIKQSRARKWLRSYPKRAQKHIIGAYSHPPYHTGELRQYLERYGIDEQTRLRILDAVAANIERRKASKTGR